MSNIVIESIMQYEKGTQEVWENTNIPVPAKVMIYATDTKVVKVGNGTDRYVDLPVLFNLKVAGEAQEFFSQFPEFGSAQANGIVRATSEGTYGISTVNVNSVVTKDELDAALDTLSDVGHLHPNYYTLADIENIITDSNLKQDDDIISYLALCELERNESIRLDTKEGYVDEFFENVGIDVEASEGYAYDNEEKKYDIFNRLVSKTKLSKFDIPFSSIFYRVYKDGVDISDKTIDMSRDGGTTWCPVDTKKSPMSHGDFLLGTGVCEFDGVRETQEIGYDDIDIPDLKGDVTTFTVDGEGVGHVDVALPDTVGVGCDIVTSGGTVRIGAIDGDGTEAESITYVGDVDSTEVTVEAIYAMGIDPVIVGRMGNVEYKTDIPVAIKEHTATLYQDKIYVMGGRLNDGNKINTTYIYDIATDSWSQGIDIPTAIFYHTATLYEDKIYIIGGYDGNYLNTTYIYDIASDTWSQGTSIPIDIGLHTATLYQDQIYVMGGRNSNGTSVNTTYIYDIASDSWSQGTNMPIAIRSHTANLYQDQIYVIGGYDGNHVNIIYIYDIVTDTWSQGTSIPVAIRAHISILYQNKIYVIGGHNGNNTVNTTYIYDIASDSWSQGADIPISVYIHTATLYQDRIYIIGGHDNNDDSLNIIYTYSLPVKVDALQPKRVEIREKIEGEVEYKADVPLFVYYHTATLYQDKIYVMGGKHSSNYCNTTYIYDIASDSWSQGTDIPIPISHHTATLHQDQIYVMGGYNGNNTVNTTYIYDIANDSWSQGTDIPVAIQRHSATLYQDKIYVIGGWNSDNHLKTTYIYNITNDSWSQGTNIPVAINYHTAILYQDQIYVIGGKNSNGTSVNTTYIYDIASDSWSQGTNMPIAVHAHTATLYQDQIYVIGGWDSGSGYNTIYIYDIDTNSWSQGTGMPIIRYYHASVLYQDKIYIIRNTTFTYQLNPSGEETYDYRVVDTTDNITGIGRIHTKTDIPVAMYGHATILYQNKLYVIGGDDNNNNVNTTYIYDIASDSWSQGANIPVAIRSSIAIMYQDKIYLVGGKLNNDNSSNTTYIYDIASDSWSQGTDIPIAIYEHTATLYQDKIYVIGGRLSNSNSIDTTYIYDIATDAWSQGTDIPIAMDHHTATLYQNRIYILSGKYNSNILNTTYIYDIASDSWSQGANIPISTYAHTATLYQDQIYMMGGYDGNNNVNITHIYDIASDSWSQGANIPTAVRVFTATLYQDQIYVIGGHNNHNDSINIIYSYSLSPYPVYSTITTSEIEINDSIDIIHYIRSVEGEVRNSNIFYALRFDNEYKIYKGHNTWKTIVRYDSDQYQYINDNDVWTSASSNNLNSALTAALEITDNKMTRSDLLEISSSNITTKPSHLIFAFKDTPSNTGLRKLEFSGVHQVDIPAGRDLKWKITNNTNKKISLHGVRVKW